MTVCSLFTDTVNCMWTCKLNVFIGFTSPPPHFSTPPSTPSSLHPSTPHLLPPHPSPPTTSPSTPNPPHSVNALSSRLQSLSPRLEGASSAVSEAQAVVAMETNVKELEVWLVSCGRFSNNQHILMQIEDHKVHTLTLHTPSHLHTLTLTYTILKYHDSIHVDTFIHLQLHSLPCPYYTRFSYTALPFTPALPPLTLHTFSYPLHSFHIPLHPSTVTLPPPLDHTPSLPSTLHPFHSHFFLHHSHTSTPPLTPPPHTPPPPSHTPSPHTFPTVLPTGPTCSC